MKGIILTILVFLTWFAIAGTYYTCAIKGVCSFEKTTEIHPSENQNKTTLKTDTTNSTATTNASAEINANIISNSKSTIDSLPTGGLKIFDGDQLLKSYYGNFKIYKNNAKVQTPYGISNYGFDLAKHMDKTDSRLTVIGYLNLNEKDSIGIERAKFIKERLVKLGIPGDLITISSKRGIFDFNYGKFRGGIQFQFQKLDSVITLNAINFEQEVPLKNPSSIKSELSVEEFLENYTKPIVEEKDEIIKPKKTTKKLPLATYIIAQENFRRGKFKASREFKDFMEKHKNATKITLIGYSINEDNNQNYQKGFDLANAVEKYISRKNLTNAIIKISSERNTTSETSKNESVTLIIE